MKKLFLLILTLFVLGGSSPLLAWNPLIVGGSGGAVAELPYCTSCTGTADADIGCNNFDGTGWGDCDEPCGTNPCWQATATGGTIDEDQARTGTWTCDNFSQVLEIAYVNDDDVEWIFASGQNPFYAIFYFKFTVETLDNNEASYWFQIYSDGGTQNLLQCYYGQDGSGDMYLTCQARLENCSSWDTHTFSSINEPTTNTECRMKIYRNEVTADSDETFQVCIRCGSTNEECYTWDETDNLCDDEPLEMEWGHDGSNQINYTIEIGGLKADDDTQPYICNADSS